MLVHKFSIKAAEFVYLLFPFIFFNLFILKEIRMTEIGQMTIEKLLFIILIQQGILQISVLYHKCNKYLKSINLLKI